MLSEIQKLTILIAAAVVGENNHGEMDRTHPVLLSVQHGKPRNGSPKETAGWIPLRELQGR